MRLFSNADEIIEKFELENLDNHLLVSTFNFDPRAYVGNEYWLKQFGKSSNSRAATCTTISESMNPDINPDFLERLVQYKEL